MKSRYNEIETTVGVGGFKNILIVKKICPNSFYLVFDLNNVIKRCACPITYLL